MSKKVLIVDDSALVRKQLSELIKGSGLDFEIETAKNGQEGVDKACATDYDVITMDINMPVMDGLTAVGEIMKKNPSAILMVSSLTSDNATSTMEALDLGAIDYVTKPGTMNIGKHENSEDIIEKLQALSRISKRRIKANRARRPIRRNEPENEISERPNRTERVSKSNEIVKPTTSSKDIKKIIFVGASTGGPGLIEQICSSLPADFPHAVCIVQHMPAQFTEAFAGRLNKSSKLNVHHTKHGMEICPGNIYLARGGSHMEFTKKVSGTIVVSENDNDKGRFFKPSVDETFLSGLKVFGGAKITSVLLTGIGDDGAEGMVAIREAGGFTMGESEDSCTVYGMPRVAFENGGVMEQLSFTQIVKKIVTIR
ncbi:MAG: chemotaxis-specific protein-glutamate methyltransferase CheB [Helicobacteraceae bacterium]|nr:chemotaxis-specific protein-glutamate methyltransferase CheB [Helicobacteraceae bacterium]